MGEKGLSKRGKAALIDHEYQRLEKGHEHDWTRDPTDPTRAFNDKTGQNVVWDDKKGQWIDVKNGEGLTPPVYE